MTKSRGSEGGGCYWNGERITASGVSRIDKAILMISGFQEVWQSWPPDAVRYLTENCWTVRGYSGCYDVMMLARGKADIWLSGNGIEIRLCSVSAGGAPPLPDLCSPSRGRAPEDPPRPLTAVIRSNNCG